MRREFNIPESLLKRAEELAREDGVSLDSWVTSALAQKIGAVETAAEFFRRKAASAGKGLQSCLDLIPDGPPTRETNCRGLRPIRDQAYFRSY